MSSPIYLSSLNTVQKIGTTVGIDKTSSPPLPFFDLPVHYGIPINIVQNIFKFCTTDLSGNTYSSTANEEISIKIFPGNFIISTGGDKYVYNSTDDPGVPQFNNNELNDTGARAGHQFLRYLSRAIFGTPLGVEFFNNEGAMLSAYGLAIDDACQQINDLFQTPTLLTELDVIQNSDKTLAAGKSAIQGLINSSGTRFTLAYNFNVTNGQVVDASDCQVNGGTGSGTGATVDVYATTNDDTTVTINNITIVNTGSGYTRGDTVTITGGVGGTSYTLQATINSVQAAILNGTLNDSTNLTSYPFEVGDEFVILLKIYSADAQQTVTGAYLADVVVQTIKLVMKVNG
jgi:hypothetical protein